MQKSTQGTNDSPPVYSRAFPGVTTEDLHQFYGLKLIEISGQCLLATIVHQNLPAWTWQEIAVGEFTLQGC
jgi:hypothetical protein